MGFFTWTTSDTGRSISNALSDRGTFTVHLLDDKGNVYTEDNYQGYGIFGGADYYAVVAEMNGLKGDDEDLLRSEAIGLCFNSKSTCKLPVLVENKHIPYAFLSPTPQCRSQGFWYD